MSKFEDIKTQEGKDLDCLRSYTKYNQDDLLPESYEHYFTFRGLIGEIRDKVSDAIDELEEIDTEFRERILEADEEEWILSCFPGDF